MRFAICNEIFQGWKLEDTFDFVTKTGYDAIEIAPFTIAKSVTDIPAEKREEIRKLSKKHALPVSAIHWVLVQTEGLHLTHPATGAPLYMTAPWPKDLTVAIKYLRRFALGSSVSATGTEA